MLWLILKPIQPFHIVISTEIRGATCFIAVSNCLSEGAELVSKECVCQMYAAEERHDCSRRANQDSRDHRSISLVTASNAPRPNSALGSARMKADGISADCRVRREDWRGRAAQVSVQRSGRHVPLAEPSGLATTTMYPSRSFIQHSQ